MNFEHFWPKDNPNFDYVNKSSKSIIKVKNSNDLQKEFYIYSKNFIAAANLLTNHTLSSTDIRTKDLWFFPIVYLYRQGLELILKSIAFKYIVKTGDRKEFISSVRHNLKDSFDVITELIKEDGLTLNQYDIEWLYKYLTDITYTDEQSDMFRYPFSFKMTGFFTKQTHINLYALGTNMNDAYKALTSILNNNVPELHSLSYNPKLLIDGGSYFAQSVIGRNFGNNTFDFYPYIEGYMESADFLYKLIESQSIEELFLPMCYLYRNGIELSLKRILIEDCQFDFKTSTRKLKRKGHSIEGLWNSIIREIEMNSNAPDDDDTLKNVELYIKQLHSIDQTSSKFRYPIDNLLELHFKIEKTYDVKNLSAFFNELFAFLDAVDSMLSYQKEAMEEYKAELRSEYGTDYYYD